MTGPNDDGPQPAEAVHTVVVGAGVGGLAVTRMLLRAGKGVVTLDENAELGHSWRVRHDSLRLNSVRWLSDMPGLRLPRRYGRWVGKDDMADYVAEYGREVGDAVRTGVRVLRIDRAEAGAAGRWRVATSKGELLARHVVLATGFYREGLLPAWPGAETYRGRLLHSSGYRRPSEFEGRSVVVVGPGVSGVDIAVDLLSRAAGTLTVSVRTPPNFLPRELYGLPLQALSVTNRYAPSPFLDTVGRLVQRLAVGDLADTPLGASPEGMFTRLRRTGVNPAVDDGDFVPAVRDGRVTVIPAVVGLYEDGVIAADGSRTPADAVIAATGYGTGLDPLVGHLGAVDGRGHPVQYGAGSRRWAEQGLHFVGYSSPLTGHLREVGILARRAARRIARDPAPATGKVPVAG